MDNFRRISSSPNPEEFLSVPMEAAIVPLPSYWIDPWGRGKDERAAIESESEKEIDGARLQTPDHLIRIDAHPRPDKYDLGSPEELVKHREIRTELFERFITAMDIAAPNTFVLWPLPEDISATLSDNNPQRSMTISALIQRFPALNPSHAISAFKAAHSYRSTWRSLQDIQIDLRNYDRFDREKFRQHDIITWALELGYVPPRDPAHLIRFGTKHGGRGEIRIPLSITTAIGQGMLSGERSTIALEAKNARRRVPLRDSVGRFSKKELSLVADAIKERVQRPWPQSIFYMHDHHRHFLLIRIVSDVYRRAYDSWFMNQTIGQHSFVCQVQ